MMQSLAAQRKLPFHRDRPCTELIVTSGTRHIYDAWRAFSSLQEQTNPKATSTLICLQDHSLAICRPSTKISPNSKCWFPTTLPKAVLEEDIRTGSESICISSCLAYSEFSRSFGYMPSSATQYYIGGLDITRIIIIKEKEKKGKKKFEGEKGGGQRKYSIVRSCLEG